MTKFKKVQKVKHMIVSLQEAVTVQCKSSTFMVNLGEIKPKKQDKCACFKIHFKDRLHVGPCVTCFSPCKLVVLFTPLGIKNLIFSIAVIKTKTKQQQHVRYFLFSHELLFLMFNCQLTEKKSGSTPDFLQYLVLIKHIIV